MSFWDSCISCAYIWMHWYSASLLIQKISCTHVNTALSNRALLEIVWPLHALIDIRIVDLSTFLYKTIFYSSTAVCVSSKAFFQCKDASSYNFSYFSRKLCVVEVWIHWSICMICTVFADLGEHCIIFIVTHYFLIRMIKFST